MESVPIHFPDPPQWSLTVGLIGRICIFLTIALFSLAAIGWIATPWAQKLRTASARCFTAACCTLFGAFVSLAILFIKNRLEFEYVWGHGDGSNTIPYRIAGIWAGQEGSFLLWACASAIFALFAVRGTGIYRRWFTIVYSIFLGSLAGILAYETPFKLNMLEGRPIVPDSGIGLSPALQNYWVTIHPPTIFLGFGSLTVLAAYAFAAMATNQLQDWIPKVRPWALVSLGLVGVGLCMGGFWAYETLGWGGFWMWDPVENVSFVPWIFTAAFVHGVMVQVAKKRWTISNLLLGGLPFILFVYGTFLTRSGVLNETSVHSFAEMNRVAHRVLLGFLVGSTATFMGLWLWRAFQARKSEAAPEGTSGFLNRESFYRVGALLLIALGAGAAIGMSVPMVMALSGKAPKVVEEAIYHKTMSWVYIPLMLIMAAGPLVAWRAMGVKQFLNRIYGVVSVTVLLMGLIMISIRFSPWTKTMDPAARIELPFGVSVSTVAWVVILVSLSVAIVVANVWRIAELIRRSKMSAAAFLAHIGVAVLMAGLIISRGFEQKARIAVQEGQTDSGLGYLVQYKGQTSTVTDRNNKVNIQMSKDGETWTATPGYYLAAGADGTMNPMVWPSIHRSAFYDIYLALSPPVTEAGSALTIAKGQTVDFNGLSITYTRRTMEGQAGMRGTKFGAILEIRDGQKIQAVNPKIELGDGKIVEHPAMLGKQLNVTLKQMDAGTGSVVVQIQFAKPFYPIELFYKPMTILVWIGTGIMGFAAMLSAWYRRPKQRRTGEIREMDSTRGKGKARKPDPTLEPAAMRYPSS